MIFSFDTNAAIALINRDPIVRANYEESARLQASFLISSVVIFELRFGVAKSARKEKNASVLKAFLAGPFEPTPFTGEDAAIAGELRAALAARGTPIGPYDILIAAQALRAGATLVTANEREFRRVEGLKFENWASPRPSGRPLSRRD